MSILETLQTDHRQVRELLKTILSTADAKKRSDLFMRTFGRVEIEVPRDSR